MTTSHRVDEAVVTGVGVVAPTGIGASAHWQAVLAAKSGISRIEHFDPTQYPVRLAGQVSGFVAEEVMPSRLIPQTDFWTRMSFAATREALEDAAVDIEEVPEYELAAVTASSSGGTDFGQREMVRLWAESPSRVSAYQSIAWFYAATTGQLSIRYGMRGPCGVLCGEQAGGLDALGHTRRLIRSGTRLAVSGGTEAPFCPYGLTAQITTNRMSTVDDPERAYLPFDVDASGYVAGEGGAMLIVTSGEHAPAERERRYGSIAGYASGFDPPAGSSRPPVLAATIRRALKDARVNAAEIDAVFADASGVVEDDLAEARALIDVFGACEVPVTAPKALTGRLYAGGSPLDVVTALLAMREGVLPHTAGTTTLAPGCEIDLVRGAPRECDLRTVLVVARGFGGFTAAVVLRAP